MVPPLALTVTVLPEAKALAPLVKPNRERSMVSPGANPLMALASDVPPSASWPSGAPNLIAPLNTPVLNKISVPPSMVVADAVPPGKTYCHPPLSTIVLLALPPASTNCVPPLSTVVLSATPLTSWKALSTVVLTAVPPDRISWDHWSMVRVTVPPEKTFCKPPLAIVVALALPPAPTSWIPMTVVLTAVPLTPCMPAAPTEVLEALPPAKMN